MRFPAFRIGPELGGRGYKVLAAAGLSGHPGWIGNLPLVLLEWAKLRSADPFAGRFPVAGGAVVLRAHYVEEGSNGPVAYANGVFVLDTQLSSVTANEAALLSRITDAEDFGYDPVTVPDEEFAEPTVTPWQGLGLAWQDRHIQVDPSLSREEVALTALASVTPIVQRQRITGWSTTGLLEARGDFSTIRGCNLLATFPSEPLNHNRFKPYAIDAESKVSGEQIEEPETYRLWENVRAKADDCLSEGSRAALAAGWNPAMAEWMPEAITWHVLETASQQGETFATIVDLFEAMSLAAGDSLTAVTLRRFLNAMRSQSPLVLSELVGNLSRRLMSRPLSHGEVLGFGISADIALPSELDPAGLRDLVRSLEQQCLTQAFANERRELARTRIRDLADHMLRLDLAHDPELRLMLAHAGEQVGEDFRSRDRMPDRDEAHRSFSLRRALPIPVD